MLDRRRGEVFLDDDNSRADAAQCARLPAERVVLRKRDEERAAKRKAAEAERGGADSVVGSGSAAECEEEQAQAGESEGGMNDANLEMDDYSRLESALRGRQLPDGFAPCAGGCGRLSLERFCESCAKLNRQMEAKRLADAERVVRFPGATRSAWSWALSRCRRLRARTGAGLRSIRCWRPCLVGCSCMSLELCCGMGCAADCAARAVVVVRDDSGVDVEVSADGSSAGGLRGVSGGRDWWRGCGFAIDAVVDWLAKR